MSSEAEVSRVLSTPISSLGFGADVAFTMREHLYYFTCPLCLQDVDVSQKDSYRALPLNYEKVALFNETPVCDERETITMGGIWRGWRSMYPDLDWTKKVWLLHMRCISFVNHLPLPKLYHLLDLVEPAILSAPNPPRTKHGAFYAQPICKENSVEDTVEDPVEDPMPVPAASHMKPLLSCLWEVMCALTDASALERITPKVSCHHYQSHRHYRSIFGTRSFNTALAACFLSWKQRLSLQNLKFGQQNHHQAWGSLSTY